MRCISPESIALGAKHSVEIVEMREKDFGRMLRPYGIWVGSMRLPNHHFDDHCPKNANCRWGRGEAFGRDVVDDSPIFGPNASPVRGITNQAIIELVSTVMVYKFPQLTREEIEAMFSVSELKQTKVYQEALNEGRAEGRAEGHAEGRAEGRMDEAQALILRLLNHRFGSLAPETETQIRSLALPQLEALGEALLDFSDRTDLADWLHRSQQ
jgi:hypothetical protein